MKAYSQKIRGLETGWLESGKRGNPILLCFHGFPDNPMAWEEQIKFFSNDWHVIAIASRGIDKSEQSENLNRYSPESAVLDAAAIIESFDKQAEIPIVVMGHDLGVVLAWAWARTFESRTKGLIMLGGLTIEQMCRRLSWPRQHLKSWYIYLMQIPGLAPTLLEKKPNYMFRLANKLGERPLSKQELTGQELAQGVRQYRAFARKIPLALNPTSRKLKVPILALWGSNDTFLLPPTQTELNQDAHSVTIRVLQGNHWIHRDQHKIVNTLLMEFINVHTNIRKSITSRKSTNTGENLSRHGETAIQ